ncbi:MAG: lipoate--protein ligase [Bacteroidales bacterium]|nr:lipoate--protein ligase [Bacteroidales bacterium]
MLHLQFVISNQYNPFLNRAVEQYLTDNQEEGIVTMYLWKNQKTVVIGYNQNPYAECNVQLLLDEGGHLMRRGTGGGAVYHDLGNINFSFIADKRLYDVKKQLSVIQDALLSYGLQTEISGRNDLTCEGRKFSGNAFAKGQRNNLHHGTILIKADGAMMQRYLIVDKAKLMKNGVKSVASRVVNLSELVLELTSENIKQPLIDSFEKVYGGQATVLDFDTLINNKEVQAIWEHIASDDFLFGRWRQFKTTKKARFPWGGVEIALQIDEANAIIKDIQIATDCLEPETILEAERILQGASTKDSPEHDVNNEIIRDIINLIYG